MCSWAAGMAREGYRPFLHTFAVFLYRRILDQLEMSVAYPNLPVVFVGFVPGITTPGGVTHRVDQRRRRPAHGAEYDDFRHRRRDRNRRRTRSGICLQRSGLYPYAAQGSAAPVPANQPMQFNRARVLSEGDDIVLLSSSICTEEAMRATAVLREKGVSVQHMHVSTLKPCTDPTIVGGSPEEQVRRCDHRKPLGYRRSGFCCSRCHCRKRSGQTVGQDRSVRLSTRRIQDVPDEEIRHRRHASGILL